MGSFCNGELLPEALVHAEAERLKSHPDFKQVDQEGWAARLQSAAETVAVNRVLVAQAAARDPRPVDPDEVDRACLDFQRTNGKHPAFDGAALRVQMEARLRVRRLLAGIRAGAQPPEEDLIRATYERYRDTLIAPERVRAAHIVKHTAEGLEDEEAARTSLQKAIGELEQGHPFGEVAEVYSDCAGSGGEIGWFRRGEMVQEFEDVVFSLNVGEQSGIFKTAFGLHIALLLERRAAGPMELEEARAQIERTLWAWREHEALRLETERLRAAAQIGRTGAGEAGAAAVA